MAQAYGSGPIGAPNGDPGMHLPWYGIGFGPAIKRFFQKYVVFHGRASKSEFWWAILFLVLVSVVLGVAAVLLGEGTTVDGIYTTSGPVTYISYAFSIATLIPFVSVTVRRLHDANQSGLLALLYLIACLFPVFVIVFGLLGSNPHGARFDRRI